MPVRSPLPTPVGTTRRTALGCGLLALTAVSGCDLAPNGGAGEPSHGASPQATPAAGDPDSVVVEQVLDELAATVAMLTSAAQSAPRPRAPLTALRDLHLTHAAALGAHAAAPTPVTPATPVGGSAVTRSQVILRERRLQRRLADWSVAAESGALARLLASMSAAVAQHVVHHLGESPAAAAGEAP